MSNWCPTETKGHLMSNWCSSNVQLRQKLIWFINACQRQMEQSKMCHWIKECIFREYGAFGSSVLDCYRRIKQHIHRQIWVCGPWKLLVKMDKGVKEGQRDVVGFEEGWVGAYWEKHWRRHHHEQRDPHSRIVWPLPTACQGLHHHTRGQWSSAQQWNSAVTDICRIPNTAHRYYTDVL